MVSISLGCILVILLILRLREKLNDFLHQNEALPITTHSNLPNGTKTSLRLIVYFTILDFHRPLCGWTGAGGSSAETLLQWPVFR